MSEFYSDCACRGRENNSCDQTAYIVRSMSAERGFHVGLQISGKKPRGERATVWMTPRQALFFAQQILHQVHLVMAEEGHARP